jgi:hypothetical protein
VGARRRERLAEALGALDVALEEEADLAAIERAVPAGAAAGERYPPFVMQHMDSERAPSGWTGAVAFARANPGTPLRVCWA